MLAKFIGGREKVVTRCDSKDGGTTRIERSMIVSKPIEPARSGLELHVNEEH